MALKGLAIGYTLRSAPTLRLGRSGHQNVVWCRCSRCPQGRTCYTDSCFRPFLRRRLITFRPPTVRIRARKPWTRLRLRFLGCHVRFGITALLYYDNRRARWARLCIFRKASYYTLIASESQIMHATGVPEGSPVAIAKPSALYPVFLRRHL
jgi:hypothetical protein